MDSPRLSRRELAFVLGIPAAWGILLLFHPMGDTGEFYATIDGNESAWLTVHVGMAIFISLFAGAVFLLLRGVGGRAASVSRVGLLLFAVLYAAYEITLGVGTGILTKEVNELSQAQQAVGPDLVDSYAESGIMMWFTIVGSVGLAMAMIGAAVALHNSYGLGWPAVALLVISIPLIAVHEPPFGPVGLALFIVAVLMLVRRRAVAPTPSGVPLGQPG